MGSHAVILSPDLVGTKPALSTADRRFRPCRKGNPPAPFKHSVALAHPPCAEFALACPSEGRYFWSARGICFSRLASLCLPWAQSKGVPT